MNFLEIRSFSRRNYKLVILTSLVVLALRHKIWELFVCNIMFVCVWECAKTKISKVKFRTGEYRVKLQITREFLRVASHASKV